MPKNSVAGNMMKSCAYVVGCHTCTVRTQRFQDPSTTRSMKTVSDRFTATCARAKEKCRKGPIRGWRMTDGATLIQALMLCFRAGELLRCEEIRASWRECALPHFTLHVNVAMSFAQQK